MVNGKCETCKNDEMKKLAYKPVLKGISILPDVLFGLVLDYSGYYCMCNKYYWCDKNIYYVSWVDKK